MKADYYINSTLKALDAGNVLDYPGGAVIRIFQPGSIVGEIFSYVERDGVVWWQLKEGGFVKHETGKFDPQMAEYSGRGKQDELTEYFGGLGGVDLTGFNMQNILTVGVVVIVILFLVNKIL